jgi:hypothetical protein
VYHETRLFEPQGSKKMFIHVAWPSERPGGCSFRRNRTPYGFVDFWFRDEDHNRHVAALLRPEGLKNYAAPSLLLAFTEDFRSFEGSETWLTMTPVPSSWSSIPAVVLAFERAHFKAHINGQTLELSAKTSPYRAVSDAAAIACAFDGIGHKQPELVQKALAIAEANHLGPELIDLLRGGDGLRQLAHVPDDASQRELECRVQIITSALSRIGSRSIVHFNSRGGRLVRALQRSYCCQAVGVEYSAPRHHLVSPFELVHGSIVEPPDGLPRDATALVLDDALPPIGDVRVDRAADTLFQRVGFDWVLLLTRQLTLRDWATATAEKFRYRVATWHVGIEQVALFRRMPDSVPRLGLFKAQHHERIDTKRGPDLAEALTKLTVDPRWLIYLPPELGTVQNLDMDRDLEHPKFVFDYYRNENISTLVMEAKGLASRAVAVVCANDAVGEKRFGVRGTGCIYTRKGRPFFEDEAPLQLLREALDRCGFWKRFNTDWVCLEGDIRPWALKCEGLIGEHGEAIAGCEAMYEEASQVLARFGESVSLEAERQRIERYRSIYDRSVAAGKEELRFFPIHLVATDARSYLACDHLWHMQTLKRIVAEAGGPFSRTPHLFVDLEDNNSVRASYGWWREKQSVVIKALSFAPKGKRGMAQPGFVCRGNDHLRLVYGPEFDSPENRIWLRSRLSLANRKNKHRRVLNQAALAIEGVNRFIAREPLERVEECIRGVLNA